MGNGGFVCGWSRSRCCRRGVKGNVILNGSSNGLFRGSPPRDPSRNSAQDSSHDFLHRSFHVSRSAPNSKALTIAADLTTIRAVNPRRKKSMNWSRFGRVPSAGIGCSEETTSRARNHDAPETETPTHSHPCRLAVAILAEVPWDKMAPWLMCPPLANGNCRPEGGLLSFPNHPVGLGSEQDHANLDGVGRERGHAHPAGEGMLLVTSQVDLVGSDQVAVQAPQLEEVEEGSMEAAGQLRSRVSERQLVEGAAARHGLAEGKQFLVQTPQGPG